MSRETQLGVHLPWIVMKVVSMLQKSEVSTNPRCRMKNASQEAWRAGLYSDRDLAYRGFTCSDEGGDGGREFALTVADLVDTCGPNGCQSGLRIALGARLTDNRRIGQTGQWDCNV